MDNRVAGGAGSSELDARLGKARALVDRGKQRRALDELWQAEAQARGNADAIRQMIAFSRAFEQRVEPRQASRLAELVSVLEHDATYATEASAASGAVSTAQVERSGAVFYVGLSLSLLFAAGASAVILGIWAFHMSDPCSCAGQDFCIFGNPATGGADVHLAGAGPGLLYAGIGLLIASGFLVWLFRTRLGHPFAGLILGFPVFYGCLLASTWAVARLVWGPTRC